MKVEALELPAHERRQGALSLLEGLQEGGACVRLTTSSPEPLLVEAVVLARPDREP